MQFRNIIAILFFLITNISFASAADEVIFVTMTTSVEVTSTVYVGTITVTGRPTTTQDSYASLTTIYSNNTSVEPTGSHNSTAPPSTPPKDSSSSATTSSGSVRLAVAAGAIAAVLGML